MADKKRRISTVEVDCLRKRTRTGSRSEDDDGGDDNDDDDDDDEEEDDYDIYCNLSEYDQAILLYVLKHEWIHSSEVDTDNFRVRLSDIRQQCGMESRTDEEDVRSVRSMAYKGDVLKWNEYGFVVFSSPEVRDRIIKEFADSVRADGGYLMLCTIMDDSWFSPKAEVFKSRIIHDIIQPFVSSKGLDFVDLMVMHRAHYGMFVAEDFIELQLKLPAEAYWMCRQEQEKWNGFKEFVQHNMESCQKSIDELNLASFLGSYLIGLGTGNEKAISPWKAFGKSQYLHIQTTTSWLDAQIECQKLGATLAEIETPEENNFLKKLARQNNHGSAYIGGTEALSLNTWIWFTTLTPIIFTDWAPYRPQDLPNPDFCLALTDIFDYLWDDYDCHLDHHSSICERTTI